MKRLKIFCILVLSMICVSCFYACSTMPNIHNEKELSTIVVENIPDFIYIGEFDDANLKLKLNYSDESFDEIPLTESMLTDYKEQLATVGTYTITVGYRNKTATFTLTVKEKIVCTVTFYNANGEVIGTPQTIIEGEDAVEPTESEREVDGYTFVSWDKSFTNIIGNTNIYGFYVKINKVPLYTRIDVDNVENENGNYILFGLYPQTDVTEEMSTELSSYVENLPTEGSTEETKVENESLGWTSYEYYVGRTNEIDYMWYKDVTHTDGNKYRAVYFEQYRPYDNDSTRIIGSIQHDNGYYTSNVYWFKFELIKWRILEEVDGKATLLAELALDSQCFSMDGDKNVSGKMIYANNYEYSYIRQWLNNDFYNLAFNKYEQNIINTVLVDNSESTTNNSTNKYACNDTNDKVYLLSYADVNNADYLFVTADDRIKNATDYAKSQGISISANSACWWLRSPNYTTGSWSYTFGLQVNRSGNIGVDGHGDVYCDVERTFGGIVPVIQIKL